MRVIFLAPDLPFPPRRGFQLRAWHQLRLLGSRHRVHLIAYAPARDTAAALAATRRVCPEITLVPFSRAAALGGALRGAISGLPLQAAIFDQPRMRQAVRAALASRDHELVHVQLARLAPLVPADCGAARVVDLVDALSVNMRRRAQREGAPLRWPVAREATLMTRYERALCRDWNAATVAAAEDREAIGDFPALYVNPNGVDLAEHAFSAGPRRPGTVAFTGNLGYFPNVDAVRWFVREVLPRVRRAEPATTFTAAGARPPRSLRRLAHRTCGARVIGDLPDLRPLLRETAVAVAPLRAGSGQLLKVLEAMACGAPLVATPEAAAGTGAIDGRHLLLAGDAASFAAAVVRLLRDPAAGAALAREARELVASRFGWEVSVAALERIWTEAAGR